MGAKTVPLKAESVKKMNIWFNQAKDTIKQQLKQQQNLE